MSIEITMAVFIGGLLLLLLLGVEIAFAFGIMGSIGLFLLLSQPSVQMGWTIWGVLDMPEFTAAPLFILMGAVLGESGIVRNLFDGAEKWLGGLKGGLCTTVIGASAAFAAISGSNVASCAVLGRIAYPEMERKGYDPKLSLSTIAVGGTLAVLIPPSLTFIIYGIWEQISIVRLFAAGLIPGIIFALLLMGTAMIRVLLNPKLAPSPTSYSWREKVAASKQLLPWVGLIAAIFYVIFGGVMTATEAASLGAFLSIILAAGYRKMSYKVLKTSFLEAVRITCMIMLIVSLAKVLAFTFQRLGVSDTMSTFITGLPFGAYGILIAIYIMYLILGCFFDSVSMMVLTLPFVVPAITHLGFNPVWFAVVYVLNAEIGMVTPPFGLNLFVLQGVVPKYSVMLIARGCVPYLVPTLGMIALLTAFPQLALWLPSVLYG